MKVSCFKYIIVLLAVFFTNCTLSKPQVVNKGNYFKPISYSELSAAYNKEKTSDISVSKNNKREHKMISITLEEDDPVVGNTFNVADPLEDNTITADEEDESSIEKEQALLDAALDHCETAQESWNNDSPEKAIESLDDAYQLVLKVDTDKYPDLIQQKEDLRFTISKRILEIYSSRYTTVNGHYKEIPLTINQHVEREIKSFQGNERAFFMEGYKRSGKYREEIVKALNEAGLPEELSWLPFIESWFKVKALSPARALGIWQFIPSTGYRFGLKRDTWIDERMDPSKSTTAAIAYLKALHKMFGDWTTVLAAYNCGEGNVLRVIRGQKINYLDNFWDLYERLPRETARYVPRFLATLHIMKDPEKYGFKFDELESPPVYESITIEKQIQLKTAAENMNISVDELIELNPELRMQTTPPTKYSLNVPAGKGSVLLANLDDIPSWKPQNNEFSEYIYHTVRKGETLSRIAAKYRMNINDIVKENKISRRRAIQIGQKLKIPLRGGKGELFSYENEFKMGNTYRTKKGDTLKVIAKKFNTDTTRLKKLNQLTSSLLYEGQILKVTE